MLTASPCPLLCVWLLHQMYRQVFPTKQRCQGPPDWHGLGPVPDNQVMNV